MYSWIASLNPPHGVSRKPDPCHGAQKVAAFISPTLPSEIPEIVSRSRGTMAILATEAQMLLTSFLLPRAVAMPRAELGQH